MKHSDTFEGSVRREAICAYEMLFGPVQLSTLPINSIYSEMGIVFISICLDVTSSVL